MHYLHHGAVLLHYGAHDTAFYGAFKSWHRFRFIFFKGNNATFKQYEVFVTTTTMTNPGEFKYVR